MPLNAKQEQFCLEYLKDLNATQAAIRAGYSKKTAGSQGGDLIQKPEIKNRIEDLKAERSRETKIDAAWVLRQAVKVHDRCMQAEPVFDREGNPTGEYTFNASGANKALELVGKHIGVRAFEDVVKVSGTIDIAERVARARSRISDED